MRPAPHVQLDVPLPVELGVGAGTAVFVAGWCAEQLVRPELLVDGEPQPLTAHGMPRLDVLRALRPGEDPYGPGSADGYRSGFWGTATIGPRPVGATVALALRSERGDVALGAIAVVAPPEPSALPPEVAAGDGPLVAICMATYEPPVDLFRAQVASIRAQTHTPWVCVVSDDGSSAAGLAVLHDVIGDDPRFLISGTGGRLGFAANFERALALAPREAPLVALADQDDAWDPDKLATLVAALGDAQLVYSDARIVTPSGELIAGSYWERRRNNHEDLLSLLVANAVTGAASLLRREVLEDALPFPPAQFAHFHDHWLGLVALARGEIAYVDRPLYDYVQHGEATLGHAAATGMVTLRSRLGGLRGDPRERVRQWRLHYFVDVCRLVQVATVLRLRVGPRMDPRKRRALAALIDADRSPVALGRLWARGARELTRRTPQTLGAEWMLGYALAWRRLLRATTRDRPVRGLRLDAVPPTSLIQPPGRGAAPLPELRVMEEKVRPLRLAPGDDAPRVNLLIPTIDLAHLFGGYIAKFNLALRLARRGHAVRIVTVDPVDPLPPDWKQTIESYAGLGGLFDHVEVAFGREGGALEVSRQDAWIATTWWTAHVADAAVAELDAAPFMYLVQEYEPFTFPMGTWSALAEASYRFEHTALFSTELLRDYFRRHGLGVFAAGTAAGDARSVAFQNAITAVPPPTAPELAARRTRRLLFYARPESHAARNLFELGVLALREAGRRGVLRGWELNGVGTTSLGRRLDLGTGAVLDLLPRSAQGSYGELLRGHDVGLALMHTPHPSLVPIEMASAGMLTVTSAFENKTPAAMAAISSNIITAQPTVTAIVDALAEATAGVGDARRRADGAAVRWSRDWATSFDDALIDRVEALLGARGD